MSLGLYPHFGVGRLDRIYERIDLPIPPKPTNHNQLWHDLKTSPPTLQSKAYSLANS